MKLTMETRELLKLITSAASISNSKSPIAALSDLLIRTSDSGDVQIHATDLEVGVIAKGSAFSSSAGSIRIDAKKLLSILKLLPIDSHVHIKKMTSNKVSLKCDSSSMTIVSGDCDQFPDVKAPNEGGKITIPICNFLEMLDSVSKSVSSDQTRPFLCGVLFSIKDGVLDIVATDGHRLSKTFISVESNLCLKRTIPAKTISVLRKSLAGESGDVELNFSDDNVMFFFGFNAYSTKTIRDNFPVYDALFPDENNPIEVNRKDMEIILRRAMTVANEFTFDVKFCFDSKSSKLSIQTMGNENGFSEDMPYKGDIKDIKVGFNAKYMLDLLGSFSSETVFMTISDEISPVRINGQSNVNLVCVVMPMRQ